VLWIFAAAVLIPPLLWYYHAWHLWTLYGNTFGIFGGWVKLGSLPLTDPRWLSLGKRLVLRLIFLIATPAGIIFLLAGFFAKPLRHNYLLHWWWAGFLASIFLAPLGHKGHDYYQLPIVFITAAWMAYGAGFVWNNQIISQRFSRTVVTTLCLFILPLSAWQVHSMMGPVGEPQERAAFDKRINQLTAPKDLIIFAIPRPSEWSPVFLQHRTAEGEYLSQDPVDFYFSHRKGWSIHDAQSSPELLEALRKRGAKYFATFYPEIFERYPSLKMTLADRYIPVEVTPKWAIYRLSAPLRPLVRK